MLTYAEVSLEAVPLVPLDSNDTPGMSSFSKFMLPEGQYVLHKEGAKI